MNTKLRHLVINTILHALCLLFWTVGAANAEDLKPSQVEKVTNSLLEFQANCLSIDHAIVYCEGKIITLETKGVARTTERPFLFVGVTDHVNGRCRWICRNETPARQGEELARMGHERMEYEFLQSSTVSRIWTNGVEQLYDAKGDERQQLSAKLKNHVIRFHPLPMSLAGYGGLSLYRSARQRLPHLDMKKLKSVTHVGSELTASWETPSNNSGVAIHRLTLDEAKGWVPIRVQQLYIPPGLDADNANFVLYESMNKWARADGGTWLPEQMTMTRWYGGKLNPSKIVEINMSFSWDLSLDDLSELFKLDEGDVYRPVWHPKLRLLLGEPHRMPAEFVITTTNAGRE